jgi:fumarylacetoacetase
MPISWLEISDVSPFSLSNIPFGVITHANERTPVPAIAIGNYALDLSKFTAGGGFSSLPEFQDVAVFSQRTLNDFASLGQEAHGLVRTYLQQVFVSDTPFPQILKEHPRLREAALIPLAKVQNHLPMRIGDYTDFYAGLNHAYNVGVLFRGPDNALQPNYTHLPVGYHGRASSVVVSGTELRRPRGQILPTPGAKEPVFSPSKKLDYELELAAFVATGNKLGEPVLADDAEEHIFGFVLMNDWSARDIQAWEYVPLGPFNSKNFGTTISPWIVLVHALEPFRTERMRAPKTQNTLLPYLQETRADTVYNINLEVQLNASGIKTGEIISTTKGSNLLFSFPQMLAHHTVTGCNLNTGDLLGSGTISGTDVRTRGSLLEETNNGKTPLWFKKADGSDRFFIEDGDEIVITGVCGEKGSYVGFGECRGKILLAVQ